MSSNRHYSSKRSSPTRNSIEVKSRYISFLQRRRVGLTEWAVHSEKNITDKLARKQARLNEAIDRAEKRAIDRIDRRNNSWLYKKSHFLYKLFIPAFLFGRCIGRLVSVSHRKIVDTRKKSPHRTFYITDPSLARRSIKMPGYFGFAAEVLRLIWNNRLLFVKYILVFGAFVLIIVGGLSQHSLRELRDSLENNGVGGWNEWTALLSRAISYAGMAPDAGQQILLSLMAFYGWMTLVWICRKLVNGETDFKLRDGLYNSGTTLFSEIALVLVALAQAIPLAIACIAYYIVTASQWINSGIRIENMAFLCALVAISVLTLYWISATILAMTIATLPGMYPMQALKMARELIAGRRSTILMRILAMLLPIAIVWVAVVMGVILVDVTINVSYIPFVPIATSILMPTSLVWGATYIYMLYRYVIDDPTPPYSKLPRKKFSWRSVPDVVYNSRTGKFVIRALDRLKTLNKSNGVKKNS